MPDAAKTSLQRLLALDKTYDSLNDRIEAAAGILGIQLSSVNETFRSAICGNNYGRHDFVFRWIAEKLKKESIVRANPLAWTLLRQTLVSLPTVHVSKLLGKSDLTAAIVAGLSESYQGLTDTSSGATTKGLSTPKNKKRKHSETTGNSTSNQDAFGEIRRLLQVVHVPGMEQQVAQIAKFSLYGVALDLSTLTEEELCTSIKDFHKSWRDRLRTSTQQKALFAQEVAWPAFTLASRLKRASMPELAALVRDIIISEFLGPLHDSFLRAASPEEKEAASELVKGRLTPCLDHLVVELASSSKSGSERKIEDLCSLLALFFTYCDGLAKHHNPRERRTHGNWVEVMFLLFSSTIGEISIPQDTKKRLIMAILEHISAEALSGSVLEDVVLQYGGLSGGTKAADLSLIARVITLDPTIFYTTQKREELTLKNLLDVVNTRLDTLAADTDEGAGSWAHSLAVPLIKGHMQRQRAEAFLETLFLSLASHSNLSENSPSIWEHRDARAAISLLIERAASLQCLEKITRAGKDGLLATISSAKGKRQAASWLRALFVFLDCIRSETFIDQLQGDLRSLLEILQGHLTELASDSVSRTMLWTLLSILHTRLHPDFSASEKDFCQVLLQEDGCANAAIDYLKSEGKGKKPSTKGVEAAFHYILQRQIMMRSFNISKDDPTSEPLEQFADKHPKLLATILMACRDGLGAERSEKNLAVHKSILKALKEDDKDSQSPRLEQYLQCVVVRDRCITQTQRESLLDFEPGKVSHLSKSKKTKKDDRPELKGEPIAAMKEILVKESDPRRRHQLLQQSSTAVLPTIPVEELTQAICTSFQQGRAGLTTVDIAVARLLIEALPTTSKSSNNVTARRIIPELLATALSPSSQLCLASLGLLRSILHHRRWLLNQHLIESVLDVLDTLSSPACHAITSPRPTALFTELCLCLRPLLQFSRPSLGGRLHLLLHVLRQLLACLFTPRPGVRRALQVPSWLSPLGAEPAAALARCMALLCDPPQSTLAGYRAGASRLTDPVKEARVRLSEAVPVLLHAWCAFQLHGTLGEGVKLALAPGVHALFDVLDMAAEEDERVKALGAAMSKAELALLRREHGEWKRFGRWRGG